mmetsp:Transcript_17524/g.21190  ORF Transcript_17524/g.21190 Transcript_17524/m.21190 type:complete len:106 (+) Transcript_17524:627-944(+)
MVSFSRLNSASLWGTELSSLRIIFQNSHISNPNNSHMHFKFQIRLNSIYPRKIVYEWTFSFVGDCTEESVQQLAYLALVLPLRFLSAVFFLLEALSLDPDHDMGS